MKKIFIYGMFMAGALLTGCNEDFNTDVAAPQAWEQEAAAEALGFSTKAVATVDLGATTADSVQVCTFTVPTGATAFEMTFFKDITLGGNPVTKTLKMSKDGKVAKSELQDLLVSFYGRRPVERGMQAEGQVVVLNNGQAIRAKAAAVEVKAIPEAPVIESAYYVVGTNNGWNFQDGSGKFAHSGKDVYEDPVFVATIEAPVKADGTREDFWFKIAPQSVLESGDGATALGVVKNGDESLEGTLVNTDAGAFKMPASDGAKYYKIELNMLEYTYKITPMMYAPYITLADEGTVAKTLALVDDAGVYKGFAYLRNEFVFQVNKTEKYDATVLTKLGEGLSKGANNKFKPEEGYYQITVDHAKKSVSLLAVEWGIIGSATPKGWGGSTPMAFDVTTQKWDINVDLVDGDLKFRANDSWEINLGGTLDKLTTNNGANIPVQAGSYIITLDVNDARNYHCTLQKK